MRLSSFQYATFVMNCICEASVLRSYKRCNWLYVMVYCPILLGTKICQQNIAWDIWYIYNFCIVTLQLLHDET